jgi:hypothetical protein
MLKSRGGENDRRSRRPHPPPARGAGRTVVVLAPAVRAQALPGGTLQVSAVVARHTSIRIAPPASITLSEQDIARGYVEVAAPVEVTVQSNVPQGYALVFERQGDQVRQAHVQGPDGALLVGSTGAVATRPPAGQGMWRDRLQLRFRFDLAAGARAGQHPWPLNISLMSL